MRKISKAVVALFGVVMAGVPAVAGPIVVGNPNWYEFSFGAVGSFATTGTGSTPSSGGNSVYADSPAWTFTAGTGGSTFTVADAFNKGDSFEVFDFGTSLGTTPLVATVGSSTSDPAITSVDPTWSHRTYTLPAGNHSITIQAIASPSSTGAAFFRADPIPEPGLLTLGLAALVAARRPRRT